MDSDFSGEKAASSNGRSHRKHPNGGATTDDELPDSYDTENEPTTPMIHSAYNGTRTGRNSSAPVTGESKSVGFSTMQKNRLTEEQPSPTGMMAWVGFGCCVFALACLSISFASPYWLETWPNSENAFRNIGLWHVCFKDYMQFRDDSQEIYNGCWWLFDPATKYYKLRQWLIPPWFISCQVLVVGCLIVEISTAVVTAMIFLHCCPMINHEYLQTYGVFAAASMMFLVTMISFVVAIVFGVQSNDRYWLPRPDQNYLSWGFGFLIISAIMTLVAGVCLFMEAQKTYNALLEKEDEYTKAALEVSTYPLEASYPPGYDSGAEYGPATYEDEPDHFEAPSYAQPAYGKSAAEYRQPAVEYGQPAVEYGQPAAEYGPPAAAYEQPTYAQSGPAYTQPTYDMPSSFSSHPSYEKDSRSEKPSIEKPSVVEKPAMTGKSWQRSFDAYNDEGPGFV